MKNKTIKNIAIIVTWLIIWQLLSLAINNGIVLAGPIEVFTALLKNLFSLKFYLRILNSTAMIFSGFLLALICGIVLAAFSYRYSLLEDFLKPLMATVKSIPVASFVVILLIWFGSVYLSVFISFLIVLPNIYVATLEGLMHHDKAFKNLAKICKLSVPDRLKYLYWPAVYPYLVSGMKTSIGLAWKSGVAAEVIGMSKNTLGERLYISKVYLETDELFAWTLVIVFMCFAFEKLILFLTGLFGKHHFKPSKLSCKAKERLLPVFNKVSKAFGDNLLFTDLTIDFEASKRYMLLAPSGVGKSTVLSLFSGIEKADSGHIEVKNISIAFQDEVFLDNYTALENLRIFSPSEMPDEKILNIAGKVLDADVLCKPVVEFSGGMKRRLSVVRALLCPSDLVLLDEPFSGLDAANKEALSKLINELTADRYLLFTGHYDKDADLLSAERINLWKQE